MKKHILPLLITFLGSLIIVNAQVGINMSTPHAPLQLKNEAANRKIVLYETTNNDHQFYGFGVNANIFRYQVDFTSSDHVFYSGTSATTSSELMRIKGTGNVGIGTSAPVAKLDVIGKIKITDGTQAVNRILVSDATGLASWRDPSLSKEVMVLMNTVEQSVLTNIPIGGGTSLTNFVQSVNTIPGATFNPANDLAILPQGTYEVSISYEINRALGTCPAAGFLINSYFFDFPNNSGILRVHSNAPSICGVNSIHSALWVTTVTIPVGGASFVPHIGRGQGGNYTDTVLLSTNSRILFKKIL